MWVGEEAIAIAVYCSQVQKNDFKKAVCFAVNHDGDSDSTGAVTGNILGACLGVEGIPPEWWERVELKDEIIAVSDDLSREVCLWGNSIMGASSISEEILRLKLWLV